LSYLAHEYIAVSLNFLKCKITFDNIMKLIEAFNETFIGIASCKIICLSFMFQHFTINCIWLMLFLHELKQVLVLVKQFSFIDRNVSLKRILYSHGSTFSHAVVCKRRNLVKAFKFSKYSGPFSQLCNTRLLQ